MNTMASKKRHVMIITSVQKDLAVRIAADFQQIWAWGKEEYDTDKNDGVIKD